MSCFFGGGIPVKPDMLVVLNELKSKWTMSYCDQVLLPAKGAGAWLNL